MDPWWEAAHKVIAPCSSHAGVGCALTCAPSPPGPPGSGPLLWGPRFPLHLEQTRGPTCARLLLRVPEALGSGLGAPRSVLLTPRVLAPDLQRRAPRLPGFGANAASESPFLSATTLAV